MNHEPLTTDMDPKDTIKQLNRIIDSLVLSLPDFPSLGPSFNSHDFKPEWLIVHRIKKSWFVPEDVDDRELHKVAILKMIEADRYLNGFSYEKLRKSNLKRALYRSQNIIREALEGFRLDYSAFDVSSGETVCTANGRTSLYQKLRNPKFWTVTADAADEVCKLVYNNRGLKRMAMSHLRRKKPSRSFWKNFYKTVIFTDKGDIGFQCFSALCKIYLFRFVLGSRCETVPKNNTTRRTINVEAWLNILLQRCISSSLRKVLKKHFKIELTSNKDMKYKPDYFIGQDQHQEMIKNPLYATIDFSNASNSTALSTCQFMFPPRVFKLLQLSRSEFVYSKPDDTYHHLNMLSAMGNGYTFEVMTMLLAALAQGLDKTSRVYGDDVIIKNRHATQFIELAEFCGYRVNTEKTFVNSLFRESCGAFYHDDHGYIQSFKIEYATSILDAIIIVNKLGMLSKTSNLFKNAYKQALRLFSPSMKGPWPSKQNENDFLSRYVWTSKKRKYSVMSAELQQIVTRVLADWQYDANNFHVVQSFKQVPALASPTLKEIRKGNVAKLYFYLYSSRRTNDVLRDVYTLSLIHI